MSKYTTLVNVLDQIRGEAPAAMKRYSPPPDNLEELNNARSRAFIHLFLKVKFGLLDFLDRENYITDDPQDGGIDSYFPDEECRIFYVIQSKFRTTEVNFAEKHIDLSELLQMDVSRITTGEPADEHDVQYNDKIHKMQARIKQIPDIGRWTYQVIILANVSSRMSQSQITRLTGGFPTVVYDHALVYQDLVFPVVKGTYYNPDELRLTINLSNASSQSARITYKVTTAKKDCDITLVFVPTIEIAKAMYRYRNSILKYNPRSYLELTNNSVNKEIASSITDLQTNEFALFNNGITVLSYETLFNEKIGQKDKGQLILTQPQIINGAQTAFTLSRIYEDQVLSKKQPDIFENKEALLKVITFHSEDQSLPDSYVDLIEAISKATNQQSIVTEADRRSNDAIQILLQNFLFQKHGLFYERKRGEYADGIRSGYLNRTQVIDREVFLRMVECCNNEPAAARRMSQQQLFERSHFEKALIDPNRFDEFFFAYTCFQALQEVKRAVARDGSDKFGFRTYGNGLQYGMYAIVTACHFEYSGADSLSRVQEILDSVLQKWADYEKAAVAQSHNRDYFRVFVDSDTGIEKQDLNFNNYYKGRTLMRDLSSYFLVKKISATIEQRDYDQARGMLDRETIPGLLAEVTGAAAEPADSIEAFRAACLARVEKKLKTKLIKKSVACYVTADSKVAVICAVSGEYTDVTPPRYWFSFHPYQAEFLESAAQAYLALGCGSSDRALLIPYQVFRQWLDSLNTTNRRGEVYWHVHILKLGDRLTLDRTKGYDDADVTEYLLR